jgi:hypothetical protein
VDAENERSGEVRERPDEDQQGAGHITRSRQGQGDGAELAPAARTHALGRFLQRRVDLPQSVHHIEGDHREEMEGLDEEDAVQAVDEIERLGEIEGVHEQHIHRARAAQDEGEAQHADQRRRDDRNEGEVAEERAAPEFEAHQHKRDGETQKGAADDRAHAQDERVPERPPVEGVPREFDEVGQGEPAQLVGDGVVKDADQRIDEEHDEEDPDDGDAERRQGVDAEATRPRGRGGSLTHRARSGSPRLGS